MINIRSTAHTISIAAAAALVVAMPASANPGSDKATQEQQATKKGAVKYCVVSKVTGSRLDRKDCRTRQQWITETGQDPVEKK